MKVVMMGVPLDQLALSNEDLMREVGELAVRRIRERTQRGLDAQGKPFQALSPGYGRRKEKELGHRNADLTVSGRMLQDMGVTEVRPTSFVLAFRSSGAGSQSGTLIQRSRSMGANDKAFYHQEGGRVLRPFFDLNDEDERALEDAVERYLARVLGT